MGLLLNLSPIAPEARQTVEAAAQIYMRHTDPWFVGLLVVGDSLKGRFLPSCSGIEMKLLLDEPAFTEGRELPLELCVYIQRELLQVDPAPFWYLHCDVCSCADAEESLRPISGTYHLLAGRWPVSDASNRQLHERAGSYMDRLDPDPEYVKASMMGRGCGDLQPALRKLNATVWEVLFHLSTLMQKDGIQVWGSRKDALLELLPPHTTLGNAIKEYRRLLEDSRSEKGQSAPYQVMVAGILFLKAAKDWWHLRQGG